MLADIKNLVQLKNISKEEIERNLGISLKLDLGQSDSNFEYFKAIPSSKTIKDLNLRIPKSKGGRLLVVELHSNSLTLKDIAKEFGKANLEAGNLPRDNEGSTNFTYRSSGKTIKLLFSESDGLVEIIVIEGR